MPGRAGRGVSTAALLSALSLQSGCAAIGDIFKAGIWVGVLVVVGLLALIGGGVALTRR